MSEHDDKLILLEYCQKNFGKINVINKKIKEELGSQLSSYTLNKLTEEGLMTRNRNDGNEYIITSDGERFISNHYTNVISDRDLSRKLLVSSITSNESVTKYSDSSRVTNRLVVGLAILSFLVSGGSLFVSYLALVKEPPPPLQLSFPQKTEQYLRQNMQSETTTPKIQLPDSVRLDK